jgi:tetratricopeptide (TPR) repeat protein
MSTPTRRSDPDRVARLRSYLVQDPDNLHLLGEIADAALSAGEPANARAAIERARALAPDDASFRFRASSLALAEGRWDEAAALCQGLLHAGHDAIAIRCNLGRALAFAGRHAQARAQLEAVLDHPDAAPDTAALLVRCLHYLGELDAAIAVARRRLDAHADDAAMAGMLSLLYLDASDLPGAHEWAERALREQPRNLDALLALGTVQLARASDPQAIETFDRALALSPGSGRAWAGRALARMLQHDLPRARQDFEQAVAAMPGHIGTWHALAWVQFLMGDVDTAQRSFQSAMDLDPAFGESHGGLAVIAAARGEWERADALSRKALRLDAGSFSGRFVQSLLLQRGGRSETAQALIVRALEGYGAPGGGTLADMLRRQLARRGARA